MSRRIRLSFQQWVIGTTVLMVLLLAWVFIEFVLDRMERDLRATAQHLFERQAEQAVRDIAQDLARKRQFVESLAQRSFSRDGFESSLAAHAVASSLRVAKGVNVVLLAWNDGELQTVGEGRNDYFPASAGPAAGAYLVSHVRWQSDGNAVRVQSSYSVAGLKVGEQRSRERANVNERSWFRMAVQAQGLVFSEYRAAQGDANVGRIAVSMPMHDGKGVVATTFSLAAFDRVLANLTLSPHAAVLVLDSADRVLALRTRDAACSGKADSGTSLDDRAKACNSAELQALATSEYRLREGSAVIELAGEAFVLAVRALAAGPGADYRVLTLAPMRDFDATLRLARQHTVWAALMVLLLVLPLAWVSTRPVALALRHLADNARRIEGGDFGAVRRVTAVRVREIDAIGQAQHLEQEAIQKRIAVLRDTRAKLARLVSVGIHLSSERDRQKLFCEVLHVACEIAGCEAGTLRLRGDDDVLRIVARIGDPGWPLVDMPLRDPETGEPSHAFVPTRTVWRGRTIVVNDARQDRDAHASQNGRNLSQPVAAFVSVPLRNSERRVLGVLGVMRLRRLDGEQIAPFTPDLVELLEALGAQATVALENQNLLQSQRELVDALIRILATAIDAKSGYTGGHCARVPELAFMLAEEASRVDSGPLKDFGFRTEDEWREFRVGAWLHDSGKVTTPEHVMDKATKLEVVRNRIHEVRMRFEVLLRDARLATLKAIDGGADGPGAWHAFAQREQELQQEFAFIARCNIGGESMEPRDMERVRAIATQTWWRHFDDRLGLSWGELALLAGEPPVVLPAREALLADRPRHLVPRDAKMLPDASFGLRMPVPEHLYHHGELYNLCISHGTLSTEERFKVNDHIVQTIRMLESVPFPANLRRVPEYAGTHHETLTGTGYPRGLDASRLSVPARIMAIADIFEALTAPDRPYKKAKTLSQAVRILHGFKMRGHIDPVLFDLFLSSGLHRRYADRFLASDQSDEVDIHAYLG